MKQKIPEYWPEYSNLCDLLKTYRVYKMVYDDLYLVYTVVKYFEESDVLSKETLSAAKVFQDSWYSFIHKKNYGCDSVFTYLDIEFQSILDNELIEFLKKFNIDLLKIGFANIESLEVKNREFPNHRAILERGNTLYSLLKKHKIIL